MQSLNGLWTTPDNKVGMYAATMMALCLQSSVCEEFYEVEATSEKATVFVKRKGRDGKSYTFSRADATEAGLFDRGKDEKAKEMNNWNRFTADMLWARVVARAARRVFPDVIKGMSEVNELLDGDLDGEVVKTDEQAAFKGTIHAAGRDFEAELQKHTTDFQSASTPAEAREVRKRMAAWDAPQSFKDRGEAAYNEFTAKKNAEKKAAADEKKVESPSEPKAGQATLIG